MANFCNRCGRTQRPSAAGGQVTERGNEGQSREAAADARSAPPAETNHALQQYIPKDLLGKLENARVSSGMAGDQPGDVQAAVMATNPSILETPVVAWGLYRPLALTLLFKAFGPQVKLAGSGRLWQLALKIIRPARGNHTPGHFLQLPVERFPLRSQHFPSHGPDRDGRAGGKPI